METSEFDEICERLDELESDMSKTRTLINNLYLIMDVPHRDK